MKLCVHASLQLRFILAATFVVLSACSSKNESDGSRTYQIPWPNHDGGYSLQEIEIQTFNEADRLKGRLAEILIEPAESNRTLTGNASVGRFLKRADGVMVPLDFNTLQATTIYAHLERLAMLDAKLGIQPQGVWPARIGIAVNYPLDDGTLAKNQAYFIPDLNSLVFVPYTNTLLPITLNAGIIAHEHFHQIFQALVNSKVEAKPSRKELHQRIRRCAIDVQDTEDPPFTVDDGTEKTTMATSQHYNLFLLRALNEGLADFYGWIYSGDSEFITHSMQNIGRLRNLDNELNPLPTPEFAFSDVSHHLARPKSLEARAYGLGTLYAQFLKRLVQSRGVDAVERQEVAKALLRVLPKLADEFDSKFETENVNPDFIVKNIVEELGTPREGTCALYNSFVPDNRTRPQGCTW